MSSDLDRRKFLVGTAIATATILGGCAAEVKSPAEKGQEEYHKQVNTNQYPNVPTSFNATVENPLVSEKAYIHPQACLIGNAIIEEGVYVAPGSVVRGDEGQGLFIGKNSNIQDGVVVHALETEEKGEPVEKNLMEVAGKKWAVYVGEEVSLAHQSQVHGPAVVGSHTFVGMQALVFKSRVGEHCVIEPGAKVIGVRVPDNRYVPAGTILTNQAEADNLPTIDENYSMFGINEAVVHVNEQLAEANLELELTGEH